jgi:hypothetical protein
MQIVSAISAVTPRSAAIFLNSVRMEDAHCGHVASPLALTRMTLVAVGEGERAEPRAVSGYQSIAVSTCKAISASTCKAISAAAWARNGL